MSRGLGRIERAVLEIMANSEYGMQPAQISRVLLDKHHALGHAYDSDYDRCGLSRALGSLCRKGLVEKRPGLVAIYQLTPEFWKLAEVDQAFWTDR